MGEFKQLRKAVRRNVQKFMIVALAAAVAFPFAGSPQTTAAMNGMNPGATPDYFGTTANYANSPLPEQDAAGNVIPATGIRKFVDSLPGLGAANANDLGQYLPVAVPDTTTYPDSDYYEISLVQYTERLHKDLPPTTLRGYMQTNTSDPTVKGKASYFGPIIEAHKDRPVRIKFTNSLPTGSGGDLFLPVDTTLMGAGMGPDGMTMYTQNRATVHLHGGVTPWISDGTPHQWITPAGENTPYPKGVSVQNVPDMPDPGPGSMTFFYTNQQSARLMFFHDHSYGLTRLNIYAGESAGYLLRDQVEKDLIDRGVIPKDEIPLFIQDKTFVPKDAQLMAEDPTWDQNKWGGTGNLWYPHVYMPNQNPYDISGANPMGRWDYGPWFWPPNTGLKNGPTPNPLSGMPGEPPMNPGVPNVTNVPEAFMDTPLVNGTAYPYITVDPKAYRFRILNASNDRSWNLQLYKAQSSGSMWSPNGTLKDANAGEVPMVPAVSTPGFPSTWPTDGRTGGVPDPAAVGPQMVQIGTDSGFLKNPVELPNQPVDYDYNRRSITVLNVTSKTLLLAPAERADVVVDFSKYAGQTLILYNDGPAPIPGFDPRYDYYTGDPDQTSTGGAPTTLPGYGPNTRTLMQIRVAPAAATPALFDLNMLKQELPKAFDKGQNPLLVPDGVYGNIHDTSLTFTPNGATAPITMPMEPKAIAEEFEAGYGRMNATLGTEVPNTNYTNQTTILLGYVDPSTEVLKDAGSWATPVTLGDGTQVWKVTHNGVDTHAIHFHLFDVQLINRVGWDGSVRMPDDNEKGWKDTVRMNPLEDVIVAFRPIAPKLPFGLPDSIRPLDPTMPLGTTTQFSGIDPKTGNAMTVTNEMTNFGWEYVWHCHILGHEENDMMRPVIFNFTSHQPGASVLSATRAANGKGAVNLTWTDPTPAGDPTTLGNPTNEIGFKIQRATVDSTGAVGAYAPIGTVVANNTSYADTTADPAVTYSYQVVAYNVAGETPSNAVNVAGAAPAPTAPAAPTNLTAVQSGTEVNLTWTDQATNETGFTVERSANGVDFAVIATPGPHTGTGSVSYTDKTATPGSYTYRVKAVNGTLSSDNSNAVLIDVTPVTPPTVAVPTNLQAKGMTGRTTDSVMLSWAESSTVTGFNIQYSTDATFATKVVTKQVTNPSSVITGLPKKTTYYFRVQAVAANGTSEWTPSVNVLTP